MRTLLERVKCTYDTLELSPLPFADLMRSPTLTQATHACSRIITAAWDAVCLPAHKTSVPAHVRAALAAGAINAVSRVIVRLPPRILAVRQLTAHLLRKTQMPELPPQQDLLGRRLPPRRNPLTFVEFLTPSPRKAATSRNPGPLPSSTTRRTPQTGANTPTHPSGPRLSHTGPIPVFELPVTPRQATPYVPTTPGVIPSPSQANISPMKALKKAPGSSPHALRQHRSSRRLPTAKTIALTPTHLAIHGQHDEEQVLPPQGSPIANKSQKKTPGARNPAIGTQKMATPVYLRGANVRLALYPA